ncbi:hypothetical protein LSH36_421g02018 [Paralvinella palmiformis]|uniref:Tetraspanin-33 n=1 Tax=Paralvinella palmiformis TaxID=53620 RepID=A0AAD9N058_9ANNE|nr:hypothetical protein LSH36_421g02018 [Paralvinella palmiformis]
MARIKPNRRDKTEVSCVIKYLVFGFNVLFWYSICVGIVLFCQLAITIVFFVYKDWVKDQVHSQLHHMITNYRDDLDLQNLIDWVQGDWLKCCGVQDYNDWNKNIYFNCSSPSRERCGVPYSCCRPNDNDIVKNYQCGYDVRDPEKVGV